MKLVGRLRDEGNLHLLFSIFMKNLSTVLSVEILNYVASTKLPMIAKSIAKLASDWSLLGESFSCAAV